MVNWKLAGAMAAYAASAPRASPRRARTSACVSTRSPAYESVARARRSGVAKLSAMARARIVSPRSSASMASSSRARTPSSASQRRAITANVLSREARYAAYGTPA
jgi:hypothetical protein